MLFRSARVVLVHGGGKDITALSQRLGVESRFEGGYRVTDEAALEVAELALSAKVNKAVVTQLAAMGACACGISGRDGALLTATPKDPTLGRVGSLTKVNPNVLTTLLDGGFLPVVSPMAQGEGGNALNVNADDAARGVAEALRADRLIFLTDTNGILVDSQNQSTRIPAMDVARAHTLMADGLINGGMIPKTENCIAALQGGVSSVTVLDGRTPHALLLEAISTQSLGTTIRQTEGG